MLSHDITDDIVVGSRLQTAEYTLTESEIVEFALRYTAQPPRLSDDGAADTRFGSLAASGWLSAGITIRLLVSTDIPLATAISGATVELVWPTPARSGDTLHVGRVNPVTYAIDTSDSASTVRTLTIFWSGPISC